MAKLPEYKVGLQYVLRVELWDWVPFAVLILVKEALIITSNINIIMFKITAPQGISSTPATSQHESHSAEFVAFDTAEHTAVMRSRMPIQPATKLKIGIDG
ncbi:unnamed protein product [Rotaria socialis]|uniref:Uncharacterized protein n=1 Tax=Rotaria socialis TaxID=392032 RepID=A0A821M0D5_9BILA|nr:unnamed protein product [Rotaria socialis]CAF4758276.1 unnamed protein product [Rotaria socialis]